MASLQYKTRGDSSPNGKSRVYFCCHPMDYNRYFETISNEILIKQNCTVWYADDSVERNDDFCADLKLMQLFVMPVTGNLLCTDNYALNIEFNFAIENHIPVLPLMQESGLEKIFNDKCGDLQFLDKYNIDDTAISYDEKLEKYLSSVLVGDELAAKIRSAFDAYVFLSYRKKDRRFAQELMKLIHKNEFCRDIAIWYDEFLIPGENFNDSIKEALQKSDLFVLAVTPNLFDQDNYVMTTEYPMAKREGKPILPTEFVRTDREELAKKYSGIPDPVDANNEQEMSDALLAILKKMAIKENDTSLVHNFFIGLAYLNGIDVEVNPQKALELIESAANAGLPEAVEKLYDMYMYGMGVERNSGKAIKLRLQYARQCRKKYLKTKEPHYGYEYLNNITSVYKHLIEIKKIIKARNRLFLTYAFFYFKMIPHLPETEWSRMEYIIYDTMYEIRFAQGHYGPAENICKDMIGILSRTDNGFDSVDACLKSFVLTRRIAKIERILKHYDNAETFYSKNIESAFSIANAFEGDKNQWGLLAVAYHDMADLNYAKGDSEKGDEYICKSFESIRMAHNEGGPLLYDSHLNLGIVYIEVGDIKARNGEVKEAAKYYEEASQILLKLYQQKRSNETMLYLAEAYTKRADIERANGNISWATKLYKESLMILTKIDKGYDVKGYIEILRLKIAVVDEKKVDIEALMELKDIFLKLIKEDPENSKFKEALEIIEIYIQ